MKEHLLSIDPQNVAAIPPPDTYTVKFTIFQQYASLAQKKAAISRQWNQLVPSVISKIYLNQNFLPVGSVENLLQSGEVRRGLPTFTSHNLP